jgi:hypothetical protein
MTLTHLRSKQFGRVLHLSCLRRVFAIAKRHHSGDRRISVSLLLLSLLPSMALVGACNRNSRLGVAPVRGRVMYDGRAVTNATVVFSPSDNTIEKAKKLRPYAYVDGQGNFEIMTYKEGDGAPPGNYRVMILIAGAPSKSSKDRAAGEPEHPVSQNPNVPMAVIEKYGNLETSGINVTVENGENNLAPFVLTMGTGRGTVSAASSNASSISSKN